MDKAQTAREWADDITTMLTTYSRDAEDIIAFAQEHGAIAGQFIETVNVSSRAIIAENDWMAVFDGTRFISV